MLDVSRLRSAYTSLACQAETLGKKDLASELRLRVQMLSSQCIGDFVTTLQSYSDELPSIQKEVLRFDEKCSIM